MTHRDWFLLAFVLLSVTLGLLLWRERRRRAEARGSGNRILFPFDDRTFSMKALDVTLRIAQSEHATLVPDYLAVVPLRVSLDAALPRQVDKALPLLDVIEVRASNLGVTVDSRIEPGRSYRHALKQAFCRERLDRVVVAAESRTGGGFASDDIAWMLDHSGTELLILKSAAESNGNLTPA
ncbi:MAG: hypothetical protein ACSLFI_13225 [Solirubrobacterales bacterium]